MHSESYYIGLQTTKDFILEVQKGNVPGHSIVNKFGANPEIRAGVAETVNDSGNTYVFPSAAAAVEVVSSNTNDTQSGTGARTITIQGLDSDYNEVSADVTMNGTTIVNTTQSFLRVFRAFVLTAGTNNTNAGDITITSKSSGTPEVAKILNSSGQTQMAIYTVPADKTAYWIQWSGSVIKKNTGAATIDFVEKTEGGVIRVKNSLSISVDGASTFSKNMFAQKFIEKTDLYVNCSFVSGTVSVFSDFTLLLVDNA